MIHSIDPGAMAWPLHSADQALTRRPEEPSTHRSHDGEHNSIPNGPLQSIENLLSHAPRALARPNGKGLEQFLKQLTGKTGQLAGQMDGDTKYASVQFDLSLEAIRQIDAAGNETFAMHLQYSASVTAAAVDGDSAQAASLRMSREVFVGVGQNPQALLGQDIQPDTTADGIAAHAADRYADALARQQAPDTPENRQVWADMVQQAVERVSDDLRQQHAGDEEALQGIDDTQQAISDRMAQFASADPSAAPPSQPTAMLVYQRQLQVQVQYTRLLSQSYGPSGQVFTPPEQEPASLDAAA